MKLTGKTVVITGASSGIGKAFALKVAKDGAFLVLAARRVNKLNKVKSLVEELGGKAMVVKTDVTKVDDIRNLFLKTTENGRVLDVVYNNAGLGHVKPIHELSVEQIKHMANVNFIGMILVAKFASEIMVRQKHGHIVFVSSLAGLITLPEWSVYVATKWGITGFADSIRAELKKYGVKVTTVHPGAVETEFFDKDKANIDIGDTEAITAEEVAEASYEAVFTNKKKVLIPAMTKNFSFIYKFMPGVAESLIEKMAKDVDVKTDTVEDEPEFSYIKEVKN